MKSLRFILTALLLTMLSVFGSSAALADKDIHQVDTQAASDTIDATDSIDATLPNGTWFLRVRWSGLCAAVNSGALHSYVFQSSCGTYYGQYPGVVWDFIKVAEADKIYSVYAGNCIGANSAAYATIRECYWSAIPVHPLYVDGGWMFMSDYDTSRCLGLNWENGSYAGEALYWKVCNTGDWGQIFDLGHF